MTDEEKYMSRCIQLARNGESNVCPNPMVGAVVVHNGLIIGEGFHVCCGKAHAEVNAIASVRNPELLTDSTLYVSLEPCSHYGKTPPCTDLIISKKIPRVVVGCADPFPKVSGRGIQKMRVAGIDVQVGVLEKDCLDLNRMFITFHALKRPFITLKWAQSRDGFMDRERSLGDKLQPVCFSTPFTTVRVHQQRARHRAILIGTNTALLDNPSLTTREWPGESPLRLVVDRSGILPVNLQLFKTHEPVRVYVQGGVCPSYMQHPHVKCIFLDFNKSILPQILDDLYRENIQSLLVEGGQVMLQSFIDERLWDDAYIEQAPVFLYKGVASPLLSNSFLGEEIDYGGQKIQYFRSTTHLKNHSQ